MGKRADCERLNQEFDRQVHNLMLKGYPRLVATDARKFRANLEQLKKRLVQLTAPDLDLDRGRIPFVIVVAREVVASDAAMALVERAGKQGITKLFPREPNDFQTLESVSVPGGIAYLAVDIERGGRYNGVVPRDAFTRIRRRKRSPLTIDEGIAVVTHYPEFLARNNCFSLLASRCPGDRRVPAIWIRQDNRPRLGWCWEGNPHNWLGAASCASRAGA